MPPHLPDSPPALVHSNLKQLSEKDLAEILQHHQIWVDSKGIEGRLADFGKTNLRGISLVGKDLTKSNFKEAYLYGAYLKKTNLYSANLSRVDLRGANLRWTNLKKANLTHTNLMKTDFLNADLREADLWGAKNLKCEQLKSAIIDQNTRLPSYVEISWTSKESYTCCSTK